MIAMGFRRRSRGANRCGPRHHCPRRRRRRSRRGQHADIEQFDVVLRFDGLIVETADLTKKSPEEVKKILLKLVQDVRNYIAKVLKRAKEKGY
jgi:hypothetical protein